MNPAAASYRSLEIPHRVTFEDGPGGLVRIAVTTPLAEARLYLQGAHVAHYQPAGSHPLLFMSGSSHYAPNKAIRGGVPICFPWFGPRAGHPEAPAHGFARTLPWEVESIQCVEEIVTIVLRLDANAQTRALWPHDFALRHRIVIGSQLEMTLETHNPSENSWSFEQALHTYLLVKDVRDIPIAGLSGVEFIDKVEGGTRKLQDAAPIRITAETDRVYCATQTACVIDDPGLQRRITVGKSGSNTTVIWNPWTEKARAMADFGDEEWPGMLCIETANTGADAVTLTPGATHSMSATISVAPSA